MLQAKSAFPTSLRVMQEVELRREQRSRAPTVGALGDAGSGCRGDAGAIAKH
ncbi:MAG: hypothetical protein ACXWAB_11175 [Methylobacter sp.]